MKLYLAIFLLLFEPIYSMSLTEKVVETIKNAEVVPGFDDEVLAKLKPGLITYWHELVNQGEISIQGRDEEVRPFAILLQAVVEHVFALEFSSLTGIICTTYPSTPLCQNPLNEVSPNLVNFSPLDDRARLFTIKARSVTLREFLQYGGQLYAVYSRPRADLEQQIYRSVLEKYPCNLHDLKLDCDVSESDMGGAVYKFKDCVDRMYGFAIHITQANASKSIEQAKLWFGPYEHPAVRERLEKVHAFCEKHAKHKISW